jgi:hypothetical protein
MDEGSQDAASRFTSTVLETRLKRVGSFCAAPQFLWALLALGLLTRIVPYVFNRSLWLDETMIAFNIVTRSYAEFLQPLDYNQGAPFAFLVVERFFVNLMGENEYGLRAFPFLCGIGALLLFYVIVNRWLAPAARPIALSLFIFSETLIRYAAEVKPYGCDVFFVLLLWVLLPVGEKSSMQRLLLLTLVGGIAVWFSYPMIFILAAMGFVLLFEAWNRRDNKEIVSVAAMGVIWVGSFGAAYKVALSQIADQSVMTNYWSNKFFPFPPTSIRQIRQLVAIPFDTLVSPASLPLAGIALLLLVCGIVGLYLVRRDRLFLVVAPIAFTIAASSLKLYPFDGRLILFLLPSIYLLIGLGAETLREKIGKPAPFVWALLIGILLFHPAEGALYQLVKPFRGEEIRQVLEHVSKNAKPGDTIYLSHHADPAYQYYSRRFEFKDVEVVSAPKEQNSLPAFEHISAMDGNPRVWVVLTHLYFGLGSQLEIGYRSYLDSTALKIDEYERREATAMLYDFTKPPAVEPPPESP